MRAKSFLIGLVLTAFAASPAAASDDLFTVITSGSDETRMMALILTMQAVNQEREARVLLCDAGGDLAVADEPEGPVFEPAGMTPRQLLRGLIDRGVRVDVCAIYLPQRAYDESDLIDGVGSAQADEVGAYMAEPDVRYFSF